MKSPKDDGRAPLTPYTGAAENSALGLFFRTTEDGDEYPVIVVMLTDKTVAKEFEKRRNASVKKNTLFSCGLALASSTDEAAANDIANVAAIELALIEKKDGERREVCSAAAMVPITVMSAWFNKIVDIRPEFIEIAFPNPTAIADAPKRDSVNFVTENGESLYTYEVTDELFEELKRNLDDLEGAVLDAEGAVFDESKYRPEVMFLMDEQFGKGSGSRGSAKG